VGLIIEHLTLVFNPSPRHLPPLITNVSWTVGGVVVSSIQVMIIALSVALMVGLDRFVKHARAGMAIRAISWNIGAAQLVGVPVDRIISLTFALGAALGAAAGAMYAVAYPVLDPYMGVLIGWKAFIAAVVGGIGNIRGAVLGGFILGTLEVGVTAVLPSTYRDFVAFALLFALLIIRPSGIWGQPRMEKL
jgi:branched-chain amino acid transport system permease protein